MIKKYSVFNADGQIVRRVSCDHTAAVDQLGDDEFLVEGDYDDTKFKVVGSEAVEYSQAELDDILYSQRVNTIPPLDEVPGDDTEFDAYLSGYFLGRKNITQWRIDNYDVLRKAVYPDYREYLDAVVKKSSPDSAVRAAGQSQLDQYQADCLAVKTRFPKE